MEATMEELQLTLDAAELYLKKPEKQIEYVNFHIRALQEDLEMLTEMSSSDVTITTKAVELRILARRVKRQLEHSLIEIQQAEKEKQVATTLPVPKDKSPETKKSIKLPPLKIPTFDGDASKFIVYWNILVENIINNKEMTDTAKWVHLRESLSGQPAEFISEIPQTPEMLPIALQLLDDIYGGTDRLIQELYHKFHTLPLAKIQTASLRMTHAKLEGILLSLSHLNHSIDDNQYLRAVYLGKFPQSIIHEVVKAKDTPLKEIRQKIAQLLLAREATAQQTINVTETSIRTNRENSTPIAGSSTSNPQRRTNAGGAVENAWQTPRCLFCQSDHWSDTCTQFETLEKRREKASNRCIKCLRFLHPNVECRREVRPCCYCNSTAHNRAFCDVKFAKKATEKILLTQDTIKPEWTAKKGCFLTCMTRVATKTAPEPIQARVLIDTAGSRTMVTKEMATRLKLKPTTEGFSYTGVDDSKVRVAPAANELIRFHVNDGEIVEAGAYIVDTLAKDIAVPDITNFKQSFPQYESLWIPPTGKSRPIDILIGGDNLVDFVFFDRGRIVDQNHQLMATKFGWLIITRHKSIENNEPVLLITDDEHIRQMFELETVGLAELQRSDLEQEQRAINSFHQKLRFKDGRYEVGWPWIYDQPQINANYGLAQGRLVSLYKKMRQQPDLLKAYDAIIQKQENDGIVEKVRNRASPNLVHYIPHHPIICPDKNTSIRVVYDASAKANASEKSLNENIHKGRKWLNDMTQTIMRFRRNEIAVVSDISKAFHQIGIREEDRDVLRFLWLKNIHLPPSTENIQIYRFKRVAFGVVASPFLLDATIAYHLNQQPQSKIVEIVRTDLYADNLVTSLGSEVEPETFYTEIKRIFETISMNMTKWSSNSEKLMSIIVEEDRNDEIRQNVLGLRWNRATDTLAIKAPREQRNTTELTKRNILRKMASVFDPLGWATPVLLTAKLFLRKLWLTEKAWDEKLHTELTEEWNTIAQQIDEVSRIELPRQMFFKNATQDQKRYHLHTFVDASSQALAAVTYLIEQQGEEMQAAFVASRSKIAPAKPLSIPKLELMALKIGTRFTLFVEEALHLEGTVNKTIWSDSKCVLAWLYSNKILPTLIDRQVQEIKKHGVEEFRYVPSAENKADVATRGATYQQLQEMQWWSPPAWLTERNKWPPMNIAEDTEKETQLLIQEASPKPKTQQKEPVTENREGVATINITHFSSLHRLLRVTENCIKFIQNVGEKVNIQQHKDTYQRARSEWIKWDQRRAHMQERKQIGKFQVLQDENGIIRIKTRLGNAAVSYNTQTPMVLVNGSALTKLIVMQIHKLNKHAGTAHILASLRKNYYLPRARREIFHVIKSNCFVCRKFAAIEYAPPNPPDLPDFRINASEEPFESTGVDAFGPFKVRLEQTTSKPQCKRWVIIFTCAVIRAVHLEVVEDMTTSELLLAFRRFIARRGVPRRIVCDNAPQFGVLDRKFQDVWKTFAKEKQTTAYFAPYQIKWQFITQHSPWMGGMYERLIRSIKQSFERTYGTLLLHHRQFEASVLEIEAIMNTRPLTYIEDDMETPILTPAHFLRLRYPAVPVDTVIRTNDDLTAKLWKASQRHLQQFWEDWSDYYVMQLRDRHDQLRRKKNQPDVHPQVGDLVLLADPEKRRAHWQIAVIERLVHSNDGIARTAQIKLPNGSRTLRPVIKLVPTGVRMTVPEAENQPLNAARNAIVLWAPEGASRQAQTTQIQELEETADEVIELGLRDLEEQLAVASTSRESA